MGRFCRGPRGRFDTSVEQVIELVEGAPKTVKESVSKDEAAKIKKVLEEQGATVEVK